LSPRAGVAPARLVFPSGRQHQTPAASRQRHARALRSALALPRYLPPARARPAPPAARLARSCSPRVPCACRRRLLFSLAGSNHVAVCAPRQLPYIFPCPYATAAASLLASFYHHHVLFIFK
jgi:hypothetical protein